MEILGFIVLIACLVIGVRFGGLGLAAVSGIGLTFFVFVVGLVPGKPPIDVMLTIMAVVTCSGFLQASKGLDVMLKYAEKLLRKNPKQITVLAPITKCERKTSKFIYGDISSLKNNDTISLFFIVLYI